MAASRMTVGIARALMNAVIETEFRAKAGSLNRYHFVPSAQRTTGLVQELGGRTLAATIDGYRNHELYIRLQHEGAHRVGDARHVHVRDASRFALDAIAQIAQLVFCFAEFFLGLAPAL